MSRMRHVVRQAVLVSGVTGALVIGAAGTALAAPSDTPLASSASSSHATIHSGQNIYGDFTNCTTFLSNAGYGLTKARIAACAVMSSPVGSPDKKLGICASALVGAGVDVIIAIGACLAAA